MKETAYNIIDTAIVDQLAAKLEQEGATQGDVFMFKVDLVNFQNFINSGLDKNLEQVDEFDIAKYKEHLKTDITFSELADRRLKHVHLGLHKLRQA